jgi:hypothetical protein
LDLQLMIQNYTVPALAAGLRDREETLQLCARLLADGDLAQLEKARFFSFLVGVVECGGAPKFLLCVVVVIECGGECSEWEWDALSPNRSPTRA